MKKALTILGAAALIVGCEPTDDGQASTPETRTAISKVVTAPAPPGQRGPEVVIVVRHDPDVDEAHARRLLDNIKLRLADGNDARLALPDELSGVPPADSHWIDVEEHSFHVEVHPVHEGEAGGDDRTWRWEWVNETFLEEYCPPWH